jgi:endogenous inhibitor of DNA gyrase (YacG/DUF329 family)
MTSWLDSFVFSAFGLGAAAVMMVACRRPRGHDAAPPVRPAPCPSCGSPVILMDRSELPLARCYCYFCDFHGPWAANETQAREAWDQEASAMTPVVAQ